MWVDGDEINFDLYTHCYWFQYKHKIYQKTRLVLVLKYFTILKCSIIMSYNFTIKYKQFHHRLYGKFPFWQFQVQPVIKILSIWHLHFKEQDIAWIMTITTHVANRSGSELSKNHNILPLQVNYGMFVVSVSQWHHTSFIIYGLPTRNPQDSSKYFAQRVNSAENVSMS